MRGNTLLQERTRIRVVKNVQGNLPLKIPIHDEDDSKLTHNYRMSRASVPHLEKLYSKLRQKFKRKPQDKMVDSLDVNTLIWRMFMIVTQQAAVHLGIDYLDNLHSTKNQPQRTSGERTTLLTDGAVQPSTAKAYVFSDSVVCMGRISENPVKAWKEKIAWFMNSR